MQPLKSIPFEQFKIPIGTGKYFTKFQMGSLELFPVNKELYKDFPLKCNKNKDYFINYFESFKVIQMVDTIITINRS